MPNEPKYTCSYWLYQNSWVYVQSWKTNFYNEIYYWKTIDTICLYSKLVLQVKNLSLNILINSLHIVLIRIKWVSKINPNGDIFYFKLNIGKFREDHSKYITQYVIQSEQNYFMVVNPILKNILFLSWPTTKKLKKKPLLMRLMELLI